MDFKTLNDVISKFNIESGNYSFKQISQGYINDTYLVNIEGIPSYLLQRINSNVFKNIEGLHKNITKAISHLMADGYKKIELFSTIDNYPYLLENENCWRVLNFVNNSCAHNYSNSKKIASEAGRIIGTFHQLLTDEVSSDYVETVKNLNYLPYRIQEFQDALINTQKSLKNKALSQIEFSLANLNLFHDFYNASLPVRVCHNDTKLNNFLFDQNNNGLCLSVCLHVCLSVCERGPNGRFVLFEIDAGTVSEIMVGIVIIPNVSSRGRESSICDFIRSIQRVSDHSPIVLFLNSIMP